MKLQAISFGLFAMALAVSQDLRAQGSAREESIHLEFAPNQWGGALIASGPYSTNFVLQTSTNLRLWKTVHQAYGHPGTNAVYFVNTQAESPNSSFWRAIPGESFSAQLERWRSSQPAEYEFRFRRMISFWEGGVRGTVRVLHGAVVEVTNAVDDKSGQPISSPDLTQFFTIDQIFDEIRRTYEANYEQIRITYDPTGVYPTSVRMDYGVWIADDESTIDAGELRSISP